MKQEIFAPRGEKEEIELGSVLQPKFDADGLIPCITTDAKTGEILMFAYMNAESLKLTIQTRKASYWSRSRNKLWIKGEQSGLVQKVQDIYVDCDQDVIMIKVEVTGEGCCHNGFRSCFYRKVADNETFELERTITEQAFDPNKVYSK
ncbi:MAG TPA: phosphoribosyl-AMP cyclohydrolase [Opitutales bacterium]|nr:phosphoribosyl-AMP cyclohydrolase [Opitutales bacterium]